MKKLYLFLVINMLTVAICSSQDSALNLKGLNKDSSFEVSSYGSDNNLIAVTKYEVGDVLNTVGGKKIVLKVVNNDDSVKVLKEEKYSYDIESTEESLILNYRNIIPAYIYDEYNNLEFDISKSVLELSKNLEIGLYLKDTKIELDIIAAPIKHKIKYYLTDRCVLAKETINTTAGTFDCYVIESKTEMKPKNKNTGTVKQWFAPGIGLVKQVDYDKQGKITGVNILTNLKSSASSDGGMAQN